MRDALVQCELRIEIPPYYPDCDTTAQSIVALNKLQFPEGEEAGHHRAIYEAHHWHLSMQNRDGGWGAFDRDCDKALLTHVPFADHNAMIDPSTTDLTARGLETLAALGYESLGLSLRSVPRSSPARRAC